MLVTTTPLPTEPFVSSDCETVSIQQLLPLLHLLRLHGILVPQISQAGRMLYVKDVGKELWYSLEVEEEKEGWFGAD